MKTKEEIKQFLYSTNRTYCKKCQSALYSVFDRLYIKEFGCCFECDEPRLSPDEREVRIAIVTRQIELL